MRGLWTRMRSCGSMMTTTTMMERLWRRGWRKTSPTATASTWKPKKVNYTPLISIFPLICSHPLRIDGYSVSYHRCCQRSQWCQQQWESCCYPAFLTSRHSKQQLSFLCQNSCSSSHTSSEGNESLLSSRSVYLTHLQQPLLTDIVSQ